MRRRSFFLLVAFLIAVTVIILRPRNRSDDSNVPPVPEDAPSITDSPRNEPASSGRADRSREKLLQHAPDAVEFPGVRAAALNESSLFIYGQVRSRSAQPLPGSTITAYEPAGSQAPVAATQADASGHYQLWLPSAGAVDLLVEHPTHATLEDEISFPESNRILRDYILPEATARIEGRVIDGIEEIPVAGATVEAIFAVRPFTRPPGGGGRLAPRRVRTDASGYFIVDQLPPAARLELKAYHAHYLEDVKGVSLHRGDVGPVELRLVAGDLMILHVKDTAGNPIPEPVLIRPEGLRARGDSSGTVTFPLIPGTQEFTCRLWAEGHPEKEFSLRSQRRPVEIVLPGGPLFSGRVWSASGLPLSGATVEAYGKDGTRIAAERKVRTDASGAFSLNLTRPPVWKMHVSADGHVGRWLEFEEEEKEPPSFVEIELRPARAGLAGQVIDETGRPVRHFQVTVIRTDEEETTTRVRRTFSDPHGLFSILELDAGSYQVSGIATRADGTLLQGGLGPVYVPDGVLQQVTVELHPAPRRRVPGRRPAEFLQNAKLDAWFFLSFSSSARCSPKATS